MVEKEIVEIATQFIQELKKHGINIIDAFLFGSQARGSSHEWSDIDIAVICEPFAEDDIEQNMVLWKIGVKIDARIAPISVSLRDFENEFFPLIPEIKRGFSLLHDAA